MTQPLVWHPRSRSFRRRSSFARQVLAILLIFVGLALASQLQSIAPWRGAAEPLPSTHAPRNCSEARQMGLQNIPRGSPYYAPWLDGDNDGLACEPWHGQPRRGRR